MMAIARGSAREGFFGRVLFQQWGSISLSHPRRPIPGCRAPRKPNLRPPDFLAGGKHVAYGWRAAPVFHLAAGPADERNTLRLGRPWRLVPCCRRRTSRSDEMSVIVCRMNPPAFVARCLITSVNSKIMRNEPRSAVWLLLHVLFQSGLRRICFVAPAALLP